MVCACALASKMDFRPRVRFRSGLCNYLRNAYSTDGSPGARQGGGIQLSPVGGGSGSNKS